MIKKDLQLPVRLHHSCTEGPALPYDRANTFHYTGRRLQQFNQVFQTQTF